MKFNNESISSNVIVFDVTIACMENATKKICFMDYSLFPVDIDDLFSQVLKLFPVAGDYTYIGIATISTREEIYDLPLSYFTDIAFPR